LVREFLGAGTLFAQASQLLGPAFAFLEVQIPGYGGALLMILPPGGFAVLGFLLAGKRVVDRKLAEREAAASAPIAA
jgi:electron transport complex protein RnfE